MTSHVALLLAEAALAGGLVLYLFWLRRRIGLAPLYLVVGTLQYLQFVLATAVQVELAPGFVISPAAAVFFPLTIVVVLLTYIEEDAVETRKVAYGLAIANLAIYALSLVARQHLVIDGAGDSPVLAELTGNARVTLSSAAALLVDVVSTVVVFEQVTARVGGPLFVRVWLCLVAVMALDSVLFTVGAFAGRPLLMNVLLAGFLAKAAGATFYAALVALYASFLEPSRMSSVEAPRDDDVFAWLTYRQRYEQARTRMTRDALTGLFNRGYLDETAPRHLAHAARAAHEMSLVMVDVDRLKQTNDQHGHHAGDQLLTFVARQLETMVRSSDVACRYGGDEFVVVLTTASATAAAIFSDRLLELVAAQSAAQVPAPAWAPASITIGSATYPADGTTLDELLRRADERLYAGKRARAGEHSGVA